MEIYVHLPVEDLQVNFFCLTENRNYPSGLVSIYACYELVISKSSSSFLLSELFYIVIMLQEKTFFGRKKNVIMWNAKDVIKSQVCTDILSSQLQLSLGSLISGIL